VKIETSRYFHKETFHQSTVLKLHFESLNFIINDHYLQCFFFIIASCASFLHVIYSRLMQSFFLLLLPYCRRNDSFHYIMYALLLLLVTSLLAFSNVHVSVARDVDFCFADEDDPYLYMATKTAYHFVHGGKTRFQIVPSEYWKLIDPCLALILLQIFRCNNWMSVGLASAKV